MKHIKSLILTVFLATVLSATAATPWAERIEYHPETDKFSDQELRFDINGTWRFGSERSFGDGHLGLGAGINYFFDEYIGAGADMEFERFDWPRHINFSLIARYPFESYDTAPYVFTGFGRQFMEGAQWTAHLGGGLDYRLNPTTGVFVEARHTFAFDYNDSFMLRFGVRFGL